MRLNMILFMFWFFYLLTSVNDDDCVFKILDSHPTFFAKLIDNLFLSKIK